MKVIAIPPYTYLGRQIFKIYAYDAWKRLGGEIGKSLYPARFLHRLIYNYHFPKLCNNNKIAQLRFVQSYSLNFDTFPGYMFHEIIPFVWDCWPGQFKITCDWFIKNKVKTAIFTSSQTAELMKKQFPSMNILHVTEGIDIDVYEKGKDLKDRGIDLLEYGRPFDKLIKLHLPSKFYHYKMRGQKNGKLVHTQKQLVDNLANSKVVIALPQCITNPERAGNIETLTQRYWEGMLSRVVLVGHAPKELVDLLGYNPVIELNIDHPDNQIQGILEDIEQYQKLVDKNYRMAIKYGNWEFSMKNVMNWLTNLGYDL